MAQEPYIRRNIHTYPFKYHYLDPNDFFALEKASIYIHIPFCTTKCHFCDYVVYTNSKMDAREAYVNALCKEIARFPENRAFPGYTIDAIYMGGGTPGLLEADQLVRILETVRNSFAMTPECEVAVEFDPGCVTEEKVNAIYEAGYTRLSMGIQSFNEQILKENNRPHNLEDCYKAWEIIDKSGFTHTNVDLIYPMINLDTETWIDSMRKAIELKPSCITAYPLEVWQNTAYHHWLSNNKKQLPSAATEVEMCRVALDMLEEAGYTRGSTTGYYHPEVVPRYCRYLDYYWRTWPLIGFGVGSKTVITPKVYTNIRSMREYITRIEDGQSIMDFATNMTKRQEMLRFMIRGLKMCEVSKPEFYDRFGVEMMTIFAAEVDDLVEKGLAVDEADSVSITREGQVFSSNVYENFYTEEDLRPPREGEVQFGISELVRA